MKSMKTAISTMVSAGIKNMALNIVDIEGRRCIGFVYEPKFPAKLLKKDVASK